MVLFVVCYWRRRSANSISTCTFTTGIFFFTAQETLAGKTTQVHQFAQTQYKSVALSTCIIYTRVGQKILVTFSL